MNGVSISQSNVEDCVLNNGEISADTADCKIEFQSEKNEHLLKENNETSSAGFERDGGVNTAVDSPLSANEEMGVVNLDREISAGKGRFGFPKQRKLNCNKIDELSEVIRDRITYDDKLGLKNSDHDDTGTTTGIAINHIHNNGFGYFSNNIYLTTNNMNADSADCTNSSVPQESYTRDHNDKSSILTQNEAEGADAVVDPRICEKNYSTILKGPCNNIGSSNSTLNHSRGIETEVILNQQDDGEHPHPCTGEEPWEGVTNMQISPDGKMIPSESTQSGPRPSHISDKSDVSVVDGESSRHDSSSHIELESGKNVLDANKEQIHIGLPNSCNSNLEREYDPSQNVEIGSSQEQHTACLDVAEESTSPATLNISCSEEWEDASSELPGRPQFFMESLTDLTPSPSSQQHSQSSSSWSSQRTLSIASTPVEGASASSASSKDAVPEPGTVAVKPGKGVVTTSTVPNDKNNTPTRSRTSTTTSLSTDFSSNVSIATDELNEAFADGLVLGEEDIGFEEVNLEHGDQGHPPGATVVGSGAKPKKKGLGGFLTRNIFRKSLGKSSHSQGAEASPPGWKLFGRIPAKESMQRDHLQISEDFQKRGQTHPPTSSLTWKKRHTGLKEASSTTALILENRPENLPAKNPEEEEKHKEEYTKMLKEAKKKELKIYKQRLKKIAQQLKTEDGIKSSLNIWQQEILPKWDDVKKHKKTRDLWWQGVPPSIRGRVWMLAIKNELNITHELFEIFLIRAKDKIKMCSESESEGIGLEEIHAASRENSVDVIKLDVARTFPHLCIFQKGGPYFDMLHGVLGAYACYRPDVGYVQGMSFIAAVFLLYLDVADAFICFANLLNKSCQLAFFRLDQQMMQSYFSTFEEYFQDSLPRLFAHFDELGISPDLYIIDWMYTLYSKSLPLDVACRVWDVFFRDGEEFLFRTALGILSLYEDVLLTMDFIQAAQFLTNIPATIDSDKLFKHVDNIDMHQKKFGQVLMQHIAANLANQSGNS